MASSQKRIKKDGIGNNPRNTLTEKAMKSPKDKIVVRKRLKLSYLKDLE